MGATKNLVKSLVDEIKYIYEKIRQLEGGIVRIDRQLEIFIKEADNPDTRCKVRIDELLKAIADELDIKVTERKIVVKKK